MKHTFKFLGLGAGIAGLLFFSACSSGSGSPAAAAGSSSTDVGGGTGESGGGSNVGGHTGTGGASAASGNAGGSTSAGSTIVINSFDTQTEQSLFQPNTVIPTDCSVNVAATNDAGGAFTAGWSGAVDVNIDANPKGSMKVIATFTNWDQVWAVEMPAPTDANGNPVDLTNKIVTAEIQATAGLSASSTYQFGAVLYVKTGGSFVWGSSAWTNIGALNTWQTLSLDTTSPQGVPTGLTFDPKTPKQIGIQFSTGGAGEAPYCSKTFQAAFGSPVQTTVYIDNVIVTPRP